MPNPAPSGGPKLETPKQDTSKIVAVAVAAKTTGVKGNTTVTRARTKMTKKSSKERNAKGEAEEPEDTTSDESYGETHHPNADSSTTHPGTLQAAPAVTLQPAHGAGAYPLDSGGATRENPPRNPPRLPNKRREQQAARLRGLRPPPSAS